MTSKSEKALENLKSKWIGQTVKITGKDHPHSGSVGEITDIKYTPAGWGLRVDFENGLNGFVFDRNDISLI